MGGNRQAGDHTEMDIGQKCGTDQHAIDEVMQSVADQNQGARRRLMVVVVLRHMDFTVLMMAVTPEHQFFQQKKAKQTQQNGGGNIVKIVTVNRFKRVRQQSQ